MEFCGSCGAQVPEDANVCPGCGAGIGQAPAYEAPEVVVDEAKDASDNKLMGILGYVFFLIPIITGDAKKSPFVKFHTNQGMILWAAGIAYSILFTIVSIIFSGILFTILSLVLSIFALVIGVFGILGIINAAKGEKKELPLVGGFDLIKLIIK